jgi:hypothetical protein
MLGGVIFGGKLLCLMVLRLYNPIFLNRGDEMMKKKIGLAAMIGVLLVFGFMFVSCGGDEETDTWSALTDVNDLAGTWQGSTTIRIPKQEMEIMEGAPPMEIPATSIDVDMTLTYTKDASNATIKVVAGMEKLLETVASKFGMPKETLWAFITLSAAEDESTQVLDGYRLSVTDSVPKEEYASNVKINQDGTRIRLSASVEDTVGDVSEDFDLGGDTISITLSKK